MSGYRIGEIFRLDGVTYQRVIDYVRVTEPKEGMLFRASDGILYELKALGSTDRKCGCHLETSDALPCYAIDCQAFGTRVNRFHWYPVEEKKEEEKMEEKREEKMEEKKRHIELAVIKVEGDEVTFQVVEQTHRGDDFTPGGIPFESSRGLTLKSVGTPAALTTSDTMYVRGKNECCDKRNVTVSALRFAQIMEAITEYNETDGLGYKKQWPQTGDLYYYVDTDGSVESCQYADKYDIDKYDIDNNRRKAGNFFATKEAAEIVAEHVKAAFKDRPVKEGEE